MEIKLTDSNYNETIIDSQLPVLIDFYANWCGPCKMAGPVVERLAKDFDGKIKVCKCDVDSNPQLATQFNVSSIPCFAVIKNNTVTKQVVGYHNYDQLLALLKD